MTQFRPTAFLGALVATTLSFLLALAPLTGHIAFT